MLNGHVVATARKCRLVNESDTRLSRCSSFKISQIRVCSSVGSFARAIMKDKLVVEGRPVPLVEDEVGSQKLLMGILTHWCREYQTVSWAGME